MSPWPDHSYNHKDHNQCTHAAAILTETAQLNQIADQTQGLPPRDLFIQFMSSVDDLTAKVRDCQSNNGSEDYNGQKDALQQIQNMLKKQTEEIKTLQHSTQTPKVIYSPPTYTPSGHVKSYQNAALASHLTSTKSSLILGWMQDNTNRPVNINGTLSTSPSSPATPFPLKTDLEIHIQNTDRQIVDPLRHQKEARIVE